MDEKRIVKVSEDKNTIEFEQLGNKEIYLWRE